MATAAIVETPPPPVNLSGYGRSSYFSWIPTSDENLVEAEKTVLQVLRSDYKDLHVPIGPDAYIHTIVFESEQAPSVDEEPRLPLVMIHGFGCGIPQFYKNFDHLHSNRKLYAIDLPGFARSTRVTFTPDAETCEQEFVDYIEKWREGVGLEKFILLGHSLGAFLSCAYTIRHPNRVRHLILDDPWGFPLKPAQIAIGRKRPLLYKAVTLYTKRFNPLSPIRFAGPLGPYLMNRTRPDLAGLFGSDFMNYVYHTTAQNPSGESGFFHLQNTLGWAKRPLVERIDKELDPTVPISLIYGTQSWVQTLTEDKLCELRPNSYIKVYEIPKAGHHVHAHQPELFNYTVNTILDIVDEYRDGVENS